MIAAGYVGCVHYATIHCLQPGALPRCVRYCCHARRALPPLAGSLCLGGRASSSHPHGHLHQQVLSRMVGSSRHGTLPAGGRWVAAAIGGLGPVAAPALRTAAGARARLAAVHNTDDACADTNASSDGAGAPTDAAPTERRRRGRPPKLRAAAAAAPQQALPPAAAAVVQQVVVAPGPLGDRVQTGLLTTVSSTAARSSSGSAGGSKGDDGTGAGGVAAAASQPAPRRGRKGGARDKAGGGGGGRRDGGAALAAAAARLSPFELPQLVGIPGPGEPKNYGGIELRPYQQVGPSSAGGWRAWRAALPPPPNWLQPPLHAACLDQPW